MRQLDARSRDMGKIAEVVHLLSRNRSGEVTLTPGTTTTTVVDPTLTPDSVLWFDPLTLNASVAMTTMFVMAADRLLGSFTITHGNSALTDRSFRWRASGD
jgi:hypothetical protein